MIVKPTSTLLKASHFIQHSKLVICPTGLFEPKNAVVQETNGTPVPIEIDKMNYNQRVAFDIIKDQFLGSNKNQLFMIITGFCGSGKIFNTSSNKSSK